MLIEKYLKSGGEGAIIMAAPDAITDLKANTDPADWDGASSFRGHRVEEHDEWSWGWMVRRADGSMVEETTDVD